MSEAQNKSSSTSATAVHPQPPKANSLIGAEKLKRLYAMMLELRMLSQRTAPNARAGRQRFPFYEACEVGCTVDARREDVLAIFPNQHIGYLARGIAQAESNTQRATHTSIESSQRETDLSLNIIRCAGGDRLAMATGAAFTLRSQDGGNVVIVFTDPQEISGKADVLNLARERFLPVLYVELSGVKDREDSRRRHHKPKTQIPTVPVDQSDVVAVYRVACEAIDKARRGAGPTLIRCVSYQPLSRKTPQNDPHCSDPIAYMESYLRRKDLWSDDLWKPALNQAPEIIRLRQNKGAPILADS
jgi:TPP-dependent pyruvate/acetoin dehydrogenase alpha subunit